MRLLFLLFLIVPIIEMIVLIQVGAWIGVVPTVLLVVFTATLGVWLLRWQGLATWFRLQQRLASGELPGNELLEGAMLLVGGALLLTPGFVTDAVGFVCLIPVLRRPLARRLMRVLLRNVVARSGRGGATSDERVIIDGEFEVGKRPFRSTDRDIEDGR